MYEFVFETISQSLLDLVPSKPKFLKLFNFSDGTFKIHISKKRQIQDKIGAFDATWIRIYTESNLHYDFISSELFFVINKKGIMIMCSEDTEKIDLNFFAKEINKKILEEKYQNLKNNEYIDNYYQEIKDDLKSSFKKLNDLYSLHRQIQLKNIDFDEKYENIKNELRKKLLKELIFKKELKNSKQKIMEMLI